MQHTIDFSTEQTRSVRYIDIRAPHEVRAFDIVWYFREAFGPGLKSIEPSPSMFGIARYRFFSVVFDNEDDAYALMYTPHRMLPAVGVHSSSPSMTPCVRKDSINVSTRPSATLLRIRVISGSCGIVSK